MSDEESFVILGSSPMSSLENDGIETRKQTLDSSLESDTPGSQFTSLKNSQISELKNAQEIATQTQNHFKIGSDVSAVVQTTNSSNVYTSLNQVLNEPTNMQEEKCKNHECAVSKLWSTPPPEQAQENIKQGSLTDCALRSPLEQQQPKIQPQATPTAEKQSISKTLPSSVDNNLAASFIMGEINSDILKVKFIKIISSV